MVQFIVKEFPKGGPKFFAGGYSFLERPIYYLNNTQFTFSLGNSLWRSTKNFFLHREKKNLAKAGTWV